MVKPLEDIRVIDLTQVLAGPFCTQQLAMWGAEVIRIEPPWGGYGTAPFEAHPIDIRRRLFGRLFANKKNITLNLRSERGKEIFLELIKRGDVVVENFSPGTMEKLGLGYEVMEKTNGKIVYCSISGYGHTGPWRNKVAYDPLIQAASGLMSITGYPDRPPVKVGSSISDYLGGLYGALGILVALHARDSVTGRGQMIDCSMFDAVLSVLHEAVAMSLFRGEPLQRTGNRHPFAVPSGAYKTKDNKLEFIGCQTDTQWDAIMNLVGRQDIAAKKWKLWERVKHSIEIDELVEAWANSKTQKEIEDLLIAQDIPSAPVMDIVEVEKHPHTVDREMFVEIEDMFGKISGILGVVPKLSDTPGGTDWGIMERGAFNEEVYAGLLGLTEKEMDELKEKNVI
jgi:CoA:oxalate CoA-transferase